MQRWYVVGVCTDITDRKNAEERMQMLTDELARSNAALQDFASIASHDLKEPLRKIQTFGGMLSRKIGTVSPEAQGYLDRMLSASARMQSLIDGLLSYSRITTKASPFTAIDLNEIVQGVLGDLEVRLQEGGASVTVAPLPTVQADALQMRQLFQNLIGNALKFRREDIPCHVDVQCEETDTSFILTIADNGLGFADKDAERIFEVFERLEGAGREGPGLGLLSAGKSSSGTAALSKRLVFPAKARPSLSLCQSPKSCAAVSSDSRYNTDLWD